MESCGVQLGCSTMMIWVELYELLTVASTSCLYLSQFSFFRLILVRRRPGLVVVFICDIIRIGRWSELNIDRVCQEHEVMREADVNETSGKLGSAFVGTLVVVSLLNTIVRSVDWVGHSSSSSIGWSWVPWRMVRVEITKDMSVLCRQKMFYWRMILITARAGWRNVDVGNY